LTGAAVAAAEVVVVATKDQKKEKSKRKKSKARKRPLNQSSCDKKGEIAGPTLRGCSKSLKLFTEVNDISDLSRTVLTFYVIEHFN
jgi:hypothetical protein